MRRIGARKRRLLTWVAMGLMTGSGPLGRKPAGKFNLDWPSPSRALYLEPTPKRIRVEVAGETVADSREAMMLHESGHQPVYYFPARDVRLDLLEPSDRVTQCPQKGEASYHTIRVGDTVVEAVAWYYPEPIPAAPPLLKDLIAFYWNRVDHWYEEDEEVFGHPRDPYHRVDTIRSARHVRVSLNGELLAESDRAVALFESNLPTRWYLPREDVVAALEATDTSTWCPYKSRAAYYSVKLSDGSVEKDLIWHYDDPFDEVARIVGLLAFFDERVEIELDGVVQERPESPWSHSVKSDAPNAAPAETRG
jgi:uncharacterized protein (DUF427 family)